MEIIQGFIDAVVGIIQSSGLMTLNWQNYTMIAVSIILMYLAIKKQYEPLLLLPIAFGMLLVNLYPPIMAAPSTEWLTEAQCQAQNVATSGHASMVLDGVTYYENPTYGGLLYYLYQGVKLGIYPPLIFLGIGCMTDFGPLIANPKSLILYRSRKCCYRYHRRCRRTYGYLRNHKACSASSRFDCYRSIFVYGACSYHSAADYETSHNKERTFGSYGTASSCFKA